MRRPRVSASWTGLLVLLGALAGGRVAAQADMLPEAASFAAKQLAAFAEQRPMPQCSVVWPAATVEQAYLIQQRYVAARLRRGEEPAGLKGAAVSARAQANFQIARPLTAMLFRSGWRDAADTPTIALVEGAPPAVETELGFILAEPITSRVNTLEELRAKVAGVAAVIELPSARHDWPQPPKPVDLVAGNADSAHYIVGTLHPATLDLDAVPIKLSRGEQVLHATTTGDAHRGQWWNLHHQVNEGVRLGYPLQKGSVIITGALGAPVTGSPGPYRADFGPLGVIEFSLR